MATCAIGQSPSGQWTWENGTHTIPYQSSRVVTVFGTKGVADPANTPGGQANYINWTDDQGNFWLLDGNGGQGGLNTLWKFDPTNLQWTWMSGGRSGGYCNDQSCSSTPVYGTKGVPDPVNAPSARRSPASWTGSDGNFWLFGGDGDDISTQTLGTLNDLWKFDPRTNQWTWMAGSNKLACFTDNVSQSCGVPAVYGTKGVADKANTPGGIRLATAWNDGNGKLWLYGGWGADGAGNTGYLDDLWSYDVASGLWTWVSGSGKMNPNGPQQTSYGTRGVADATHTPGHRVNSMAWADNAGHLWLFSGLMEPNDLWMYDPASNQWTWVSGANTTICDPVTTVCPSSGVYGTQGVASAANAPGMRWASATWTDEKGRLWLYGGVGLDSTPRTGYLNDLWQFDPSTSLWTWINGASSFVCGTSNCWTPAHWGVMGTPDPANTPGGRSQVGGWRDLYGNFWLSGGDHFLSEMVLDYLVLESFPADMWMFTPPSVFPTLSPAPTFSVAGGIYSAPQSVSISDSTPGAAIYYTLDGSTPTTASHLYSAPLALSTNTTLKAIAIAPGCAPSTVVEAYYIFKWSFSLNNSAGSPPTINIPVGGAGSFTLAASPAPGSTFPASVSFTATGLPKGADATFTPATIAQGAGRTVLIMNVQTHAAAAVRASRSPSVIVLGFLCLPWLLRVRKLRSTARHLLCWGTLMLLALSACTACGGGGTTTFGGGGGTGGGSATPAGTYPIVVTATCGQTQASFQVTIVVQ